MAEYEQVTFTNAAGVELAGALHTPTRATPLGVALFAHCFTCDRNSLAAARISRALADQGFAVLRFDFTGLGGSAGDFGNTGFASNVDDIRAAADYLRQTLQAPALLVGHSLGGTAVLAAAADVTECRAVVTIGSPASPGHVTRLFKDPVGGSDTGTLELTIGGREFRVQADFVNRFEEPKLTAEIGRLKKALLIFHAPFDAVVSIDEAGKLFQAARHPKSFISLDGADHLLTDTADAQYVASTIAAWVMRYLQPAEGDADNVPGGHVRVAELNHKFLRHVAADDHQWLADEPTRVGGDNRGPDPYEHLLAALGTCTSMTLRMYAQRKQLPLEDVDIELRHERVHADDCADCEAREGYLDIIHRSISLRGDLTEAEVTRLLEIADRCPVHRTLENEPIIKTTLVEAQD